MSSHDLTRSVLSTTADPVDSPYPPPFASLVFGPSSSSPSDTNKPFERSAHPQETPPAFSSLPPLQGSSSSSAIVHHSVVADTKAALPRDTKEGSPSKDIDDGEPPPPYSEGSSPLDSFTYVMANAGGPASIITQVQQGGGGAPLSNLASGEHRGCIATRTLALTIHEGGADENITLDLRYALLQSTRPNERN